MAGSSVTMDSAGDLPVGMWFYSFMFDDKHLLPGRVASGTLPAPSSLLLGVAVGMVLTAVRFALDATVFKVGRSEGFACRPLSFAEVVPAQRCRLLLVVVVFRSMMPLFRQGGIIAQS